MRRYLFELCELNEYLILNSSILTIKRGRKCLCKLDNFTVERVMCQFVVPCLSVTVRTLEFFLTGLYFPTVEDVKKLEGS